MLRFILIMARSSIVRTEKLNLEAVIMPVPRDLSSSCGTCVRFETEGEFPEKNEEIEQIVRIEDAGYVCMYHADEE